MKTILATVFLVIGMQNTFTQGPWMNIVERGADNTGKEKCTGIVNGGIASLATAGGGTLFFPAGEYLCGPIILKSNITLYLDPGAVIRFSDDFDDYLPMVPSRWEDVRVVNFVSPIYAYQCKNIAIRGDGHFEGQGKKWWDHWYDVRNGAQRDTSWEDLFREANAEMLSRIRYFDRIGTFLRPPLLTAYECTDVLIEGVSFSNPPFWTLMPVFCENVTITGITITNPGDSPNTDGIDISSCRNVHISNCHLDVGDDCIVIKSGRDEDGRAANRPTENITITNCTMLQGHGGVVIGSEMSGSVRRVAISNCVFEGTDRGIRIKTMRGRGGVVEDIRVSNVIMNNILNEGVVINMRYQPTIPEALSERTPAVRNIHLSGITIRNAERAIGIYGLDEQMVKDVTFRDFEIISRKGLLFEYASNISVSDISLGISEGVPVECKASENLNFNRLSLQNRLTDNSLYRLSDCSRVVVSNHYITGPVELFVDTDGECRDLYLVNNILPLAKKLVKQKGAGIQITNNILSN